MKSKLTVLSLLAVLVLVSMFTFATDNRKHLEGFSKKSEYEELREQLTGYLDDYYSIFCLSGTIDDAIYGPDRAEEPGIKKSIDGILECQKKLEKLISQNELSEDSALIIQKQSMISAKGRIISSAEYNDSYYIIPRIVRKHDYLCSRVIKAEACCCKDATKKLRKFALKVGSGKIDIDDLSSADRKGFFE